VSLGKGRGGRILAAIFTKKKREKKQSATRQKNLQKSGKGEKGGETGKGGGVMKA